jgi:hypothetical protein
MRLSEIAMHCILGFEKIGCVDALGIARGPFGNWKYSVFLDISCAKA